MKTFFLGIFFCTLFAISTFAQRLSQQERALIQEVQSRSQLAVIQGDTGVVYNGNVKIWYEYIRPPQQPSKGTIMFVMGLSVDALGWSNGFLKPFLDNGYAVIRFDNRCIGASSWVKNKRQTSFTLTDMAMDAFAILDSLKLDKVHLVGLSMGGMIAQQMAILQPARFQTFTSMMSSGFIYDKKVKQPTFRIQFHIAWNVIRAVKGDALHKNIRRSIYINRKLDTKKIDSLDIEWIAAKTIYNLRQQRNGHQWAALAQKKAIARSGSRYEGLSNLKIPTLIIHGTADELVPIQHGKKCASLIPNAQTLYLDKMGHVLSMVFRSTITDAMLQHLQQ